MRSENNRFVEQNDQFAEIIWPLAGKSFNFAVTIII